MACGVTFWCGQQTSAPVMWSPVKFSPTGRARPTLTGEQRGLEGALIEAGKTAEEIRRRTTCIVRSNDPGEARVYTRLGGELIAVANRAFRSEPGPILWSTGEGRLG